MSDRIEKLAIFFCGIMLGVAIGAGIMTNTAEAARSDKLNQAAFDAKNKRDAIFETYDVPTMMQDSTIDAITGVPQIKEYLKFFRDAIETIDPRFKR